MQKYEKKYSNQSLIGNVNVFNGDDIPNWGLGIFKPDQTESVLNSNCFFLTFKHSFNETPTATGKVKNHNQKLKSKVKIKS